MKELWGVRLTDGKYHWSQIKPSPTARSRAHQESFRLNFRVDSSRRDAALSLVAHDLADKGVAWAVPLGDPTGPWRIDLAKLRSHIYALGEQEWMDGERIVMPVFDVIESPYSEPDPAGGKTAAVCLTVLMDARRVLTSIPLAQDLLPYLSAFQRDHPDPSKAAFLMMPFGDTPAHTAIATCVRNVCSSLGLAALRADDHSYSDDLLQNIRTYMHGCGFGIAVFERLTSDHFNPNVSLEVGYMLALGKPTCLLKDHNLTSLHADLVGRLYEKFDPQRVRRTISPVLRRWLRSRILGIKERDA